MTKKDLFWTDFFQYLLEKYPGKQLHFNWLDRLIILWKLNIQEDSIWWIRYYEVSIATNNWATNPKRVNTINEISKLIDTQPYKQNISI